jgi:hypothetical protein
MKANAAATSYAVDDRIYVTCWLATEAAERLMTRREPAEGLISCRNTPDGVKSRNALLHGTARVDCVGHVELVAPDTTRRRATSWTRHEHDRGSDGQQGSDNAPLSSRNFYSCYHDILRLA